MKTPKRFLLAILAVSAVVSTLSANSPFPAPTNVPRAQYPQLDDEGRGTFQLKAPESDKVQVNLPQGRFDMTKDEEGTWSVTTPPLEPGFHYYAFDVDGLMVFDSGSHAFYGAGRHGSGIDVPEPGVDFYDVKDVPHGTLRLERYYSNVTKSWRQLIVYTPPGYDEHPEKSYPTLYIQHGGGEDETGWANQGKTDLILDNLIAEDKATPMLVVISNGNLPRPEGVPFGYSREGMVPFRNEMLNNIIPFIDGKYRTIPDSKNRALAGLSMGGGQAFIVGLASPNYFGSIGVFSTGLFGGIRSSQPFDVSEYVPGLLVDPKKTNAELDLFYISCGEQDQRIEHTKSVVSDFQAQGLEVEFNSFPGGHEWQVWRKSLHDFAQKVF